MKNTTSELPPCKFGEKCYRRNPDHLRNFSHPQKQSPNKQSPEAPEAKFPARPKTSVSPKPVAPSSPAAMGDSASPPRRVEVESAPGKAQSLSLKAAVQTVPSQKRQITDFFAAKNRPVVEDGSTRKRKADATEPISKEKDVHVEMKKTYRSPQLSDEVKDWIQSSFSLTFPEDFFSFWRYCCLKNPTNPCEALVPSLGLHLVGPYDVLSEKIDRSLSFDDACLHWRYFYDPPEMVTVLAELEDDRKDGLRKPSSSGFHIGYFRDEPDQSPVFVVWNYASQNGNLLIKGDNVFASVRLLAEENLRQKKFDEARNKLIREELDGIAKFLAENHLTFSMDVMPKSVKAREKQVVAKTFHGAGLVVPVVDDVGYRPLPESAAGLKKIFLKISASKSEKDKLKALEPLQEIVTLCQFANDEGDFGEGIELGLDLFTFGSDTLHSTIMHLLPLGYRLANREKFAEVVEKHLANRHTLSENIDYAAKNVD